METETFIQMAYALGIGLLVGLERSMGTAGFRAATAGGADVPEQDDLGGAASLNRVAAKPPTPEAQSDEEPSASKESAAAEAPTPEAQSDEESGAEEGAFLGVRTFSIISLLGFGAVLVSEHFALLAPVALAAVALLVISLYSRTPGVRL